MMVNLTHPALGLAAADYVVEGLSVLPCEPGGKRPLWGLGWEDASSEPEQVMEWWSLEPRANIGVACTDDLVVVDVDGPEGEGNLGPVPMTREVVTGRREGGRHLWWQRPPGLTEGWRWGGLELKASGYVLAPPSVHPSGAWYYLATDAERLPLPEHLKVSPRPALEIPLPTAPTEQDPRRLQAAAQAALDGELEKLRAKGREPGSGRHTALYAAAAAMGHHEATGGITRSEVEAALWSATPALLGLPQDAETWHQIQHGLVNGAAEPYQLRERPMPARTSGYVREEAPPPTARRAARLRSFAEVTMREVEWAWDQRVPLGKLTVLAGLPGQGKSLLTCWLAACASKGLLPGALKGEPVDVVMVSAEDDPEDTTLPRILRTGGDTARIHTMDVREGGAAGKDYTRSVLLPQDTPAILGALEATGARLLVLDPISGLLSLEHSAYNAQQVRQALGPLKQAAEERHAAVVLVTHVLTKAQGTDPLQRLADSHAFAGLPRSVLIFGPDPEDEQGDRGSGKVLTVAKSNLAARGEHGLRFSILEAMMVGDGRSHLGWTASIRLDGETSTTAADTLASSEERHGIREAMEFLRGELAEGPAQAGAMIKAAESVGIAERTLRRAREQICKRPFKRGPGPWYWELRPGDPGHLGQVGQVPDAKRGLEGGQGGQDDHPLVVQLFPDGPEGPEGSSN